MKIRPSVNWVITFLALGFWAEETAYFGWNAWPQSPAELICDGIATLIFALAWLR